MQVERSATSVSWIPSDSIRGLYKLPWSGGVMHYDPPPPLTQARVAETAPGMFTAEQLGELAQGHHREDSAAGR